MQKRPAHILPLIVLSQFAGTSLWFAGNAILPDIRLQLGLESSSPGNITSFVQFGFIAGTLVFALLAIADRFKPSLVFFACSVLAAVANICIVWLAQDSSSLLTFRFLTGFFLAGIYPVGMKIAADWYEKGLGTALGWLVGALVLGTAFPHLLKGALRDIPWQNVIGFTSLFAVAGGLLMLLFVQEGPGRKKGQSFHPKHIAAIFRSTDFRSASFGYFGHMWELYTFWAFVPLLLAWNKDAAQQYNISSWSFIIIGTGCLACIAGGYLSKKAGSAKVAFYSLLISGCCCLLSFLVPGLPGPLLLVFLLVWGAAVIADSPQFSALVAQTAPPEYKGTALTLVTSIGFAITIASLQLISFLAGPAGNGNNKIFIWLGIGPLTGLLFLYRLLKKR